MRSWLTFGVLASSVVWSASLCAAAGDPPLLRTDGLFDDWAGVEPAAIDPEGDAQGGFDLLAVSVQARATRAALRLELADVIGIQEGHPADLTLLMAFTLPNGDRLEINTRARRALFIDDSPGLLAWGEFGYHSAPTHSSDAFEIELDLGLLGAEPGDEIMLEFQISDSLDKPIRFTLDGEPDPVVRRSAERLNDEHVFRVNSLNTLRTGLGQGSPSREALSRVLASSRADVITVQEEYNTDAAYLAQLFADIADPPDAEPWNVAKSGDNAIGSRWPVIALPTITGRFLGAVVDLPQGPVLVYSIHLKCCGFDGSQEDQQRIGEVSQLAAQVAQFRAGQLGDELAAFADVPLLVAGDWNLVGSRTPLTVLEDDAGVAITAPLLPHLIGEAVFTWRDDFTSFWPGRLDLMGHSAPLEQRSGFVLDTARLDAQELASLGLQSGDSAASDHLMMVADYAFATTCRTDWDANGAVNAADVGAFLSDYFLDILNGTLVADFDTNGVVNPADVGAFLSVYFPELADPGCSGG